MRGWKGEGGSVAWCQQPAAVLIYTKRSQACNATRAAKQGDGNGRGGHGGAAAGNSREGEEGRHGAATRWLPSWRQCDNDLKNALRQAQREQRRRRRRRRQMIYEIAFAVANFAAEEWAECEGLERGRMVNGNPPEVGAGGCCC